MKLVKCSHYRCGEIDGTTYLMAPDGTTEEEFEKDAQESADWQIAAIQRWRGSHEKPKQPSYPYPTLHDFPDSMTIAEARAIHEEGKKQWEEYRRLEQETTKPFAEYMRTRGYLPLWEYEGEDMLTATVSWGHPHGLYIEMSDGHPVDYKACEKEKPRVRTLKEDVPPPPPDPPPARIIQEGVRVGVEGDEK